MRFFVLPRHLIVSIHASVKDATKIDRLNTVRLCFNPRVREGRDPFTPLSVVFFS